MGMCILFQDDYKNHTDIVSLPICNIQLKGQIPNRKPYPKELVTYGDHLKKRRLDLDLSQPEVAKMLKVQTDTITNWELNRNHPQINFLPRIISFLGYIPKFSTDNSIKRYRIEKGITQREMAKILKIDPATLARIERGRNVSNMIKERLKSKM